MGGHSSGPSAYEIEQRQKAAEEKEKRRMDAERLKSIQSANSAPETEGAQGGDAGAYGSGALARKRRGGTLAGEGAQTFGGTGSLGG